MKRLFYIIVVLLSVGCVDREIDLSKVEGNIGINADDLTFPLAYMPERTLESIIQKAELTDTFVADPTTGDYSISYSADNQSINIAGADGNFVLPAKEFNITLDYPTFTIPDYNCDIEALCYIGGNLNDSELLIGQTVNSVAGIKVTGQKSGTTGYTAEVELPDYIEHIERIYIAHPENLPGAPVVGLFDLGSLGDINGGGSVTIELKVPDGYEIYDEQLNPIQDNIYRIENRAIAVGEHTVSFTMYVGSVINQQQAVGGQLIVPEQIEYTISYDLVSAEGTVTIADLPTLSLSGTFECEDVDIVLGQMELFQQMKMVSNVTIDSFNQSIKSIKSVDMSSGDITLYINGLNDWSEDAVMADVPNSILVDVVLPQTLKVSSKDEKVTVNSDTNTLSATLAQLQYGVTLNIDKLDFGSEGIAPTADGKINIPLEISLGANLEQGTKVRLSHLQYTGGLNISAGYNQAELTAATVTGRVDYSHNESISIEVADLGEDIDIEVEGLGLSPVIDFWLANSLTLPLYVEATLSPVRDGEVIGAQSVALDRFELQPASVGATATEIVPTTTKVRIANNAEAEQGVVAIACDFEQLFKGGIPEQLQVDLSVATDAETDMSLVLAQYYPITYGYGLNMPLAFGSALDIKYTGSADGIGQTVSEMEMELSVSGKAAIICEVENSMPLNLELSLELLDINGAATDIQIIPVGEPMVKGSADGKTPQTSSVTFELRSTDSNILDDLEAVETLRYTLKATSAADGVALNRSQTIAATFALNVDGNVNINITGETL